MDDNTKLNERLSVADLRMYEGKKDGKDLSTSLSKIIIALLCKNLIDIN